MSIRITPASNSSAHRNYIILTITNILPFIMALHCFHTFFGFHGKYIRVIINKNPKNKAKKGTETHTTVTICERCFYGESERQIWHTTNSVYAASVIFFFYARSSNVAASFELCMGLLLNLVFEVWIVRTTRHHCE